MSRKCSGKKSNGDPCPNWAMKGGFVCHAHGGKAPQVLAKAEVRAELFAWNVHDETVDPGETLLRLVTQSWGRANLLAAELTAYAENKDVASALTSELARKQADERDVMPRHRRAR